MDLLSSLLMIQFMDQVYAFISDPHSVKSSTSDMGWLRTAREAAKFGAVGGLVGAVSTAGVTWKYSRSLHGTALSFGAGAVFGWTFGQVVANHWLQLYRMDTMASQVKFMEWWQNKVEGQS
ncbi:succinate dehydrogenase subunit 6, mitochondrial-like isoform X2 [Lycium barbarum]|nr:succinate dehydrogenase subunit 6, mitochondrial-like isoform X2 [Lycium barbarum]